MNKLEYREFLRLKKARKHISGFFKCLTDNDKRRTFTDVQDFNNYYNRLTAICDFRIYDLETKKGV